MAGKTTKLPQERIKIVSVTPQMKDGAHAQDNWGNYRHKVKAEGKDYEYGMSTKDPGAGSLTVGKEIDIIPSKWESDDGTMVFHNASIVKTDSPYRGGGGAAPAPKGVKQYKAECIAVAAANAASTIAMKDDLSEKDFGVYLKAYLNPMYAELDKLFGE